MNKVELDVRPVEPKDRFDTIIGQWEKLQTGDKLFLTVDHDPKCMYYTIISEYGEDSMSFDYLEEGPETWKVEVTRK